MNLIRITFVCTLCSGVNFFGISQENRNQVTIESSVDEQLNSEQMKFIESLNEMGETDLLKSKEFYTYKLRTNPENGDRIILDLINQRIKIVRGNKID